MTTVGNTSTPSYGWNATGLYNEIAQAFSCPAAGQLGTIHGYFAGSSTTIAAKLCIWDSSGNLLGATPQFTAPSGSQNAGSQSWNVASLASPITVTAGQTIYIGWWTDPNKTLVFSNYSSGSWKGVGNASAPGSIAGAVTPGSPYFQGGIGAYAEYTTTSGGTGIYVKASSSAWPSTPIVAAYVKTATSTWTQCVGVYVKTGSSTWTQIQ